jgi:hypothetical protein
MQIEKCLAKARRKAGRTETLADGSSNRVGRFRDSIREVPAAYALLAGAITRRIWFTV